MGQREDMAAMRAEIRRLNAQIAQRPLSPLAGGHRRTTALLVKQTAHGLAAKDPVRHNGTAWVKSTADTAANAVVAGLVVTVLSANAFVLATGGQASGLTGLTAGAVHYLASAGGLTTTAPTIAVPVLLADTSSSGVLIFTTASASVLSANGLVYGSGTVLFDATSGSGSTSAPGDGLLYMYLTGGGGGGGRSYSESIGFIATTSGGSPTREIFRIRPGGGGGSGMTRLSVRRVTNGQSIAYSVGAGGAKGSSSGASGAAGGDTSITIGGAYVYTADGGYGGIGGNATPQSMAGAGGKNVTKWFTMGSSDMSISTEFGTPGEPGLSHYAISTYTAYGGMGGGQTAHMASASAGSGNGGSGEGYSGGATADQQDGSSGYAYAYFIAG